MDSLLSMYAGMGIMAAFFGVGKLVGWMIEVESARAQLERAVEQLERRLDRLEGRKP